jgi:hypothetical protein
MIPKGVVEARLHKDDEFAFVFQLYYNGEILLAMPLNSEMDLYFKGDNVMEWVLRRQGGHMQHLRLVLETNTKMFKLAISQALFEISTGKTLEDVVDEQEREWVLSSHVQSHGDNDARLDMDIDEGDHYAMTDDEEFVDCEPEPAPAHNPSYRDLNESEEESEEEELPRNGIRSGPTPRKSTRSRQAPKSGKKSLRMDVGREANSVLVSGKAQNRSFVVRNQQIGVFRYSDDGELEYQNRLRSVKTSSGDVLRPDLAQLHDRDTQMLLIDTEDRSKVHQLDLETGKVVESWEGGDDSFKFNKLAPRQKYAQTTSEQMIVGTSDTGIFAIDPRMNTRNKIAQTEQFFYKTKGVDLDAVTTTGDGYLAVASKKGDIRLFNKIGKGYCKTQLPGLGSPILSVDSTEDGAWLVATCKNYLLVFPLITGAGKTGFEARMGKEKPLPLKLTISPEDLVKYGIDEVNFTAAKFNTGTLANATEQWVATSTGPWVVTWDFEKVKKGQRMAYKIKNTNAQVVSDVFRHNHMNELVVAQSNDVFTSRLNQKK